MKNKKTIKKIKLATKNAAKKTGSFIKKANKKADKMAETLRKEWEKEQPQRKKLKDAANKALEHGIKIGSDVFDTIRKDIDEINNQNKNKKKGR